MPALPPSRPVDRIVVARRLAAGMSVEAVARSCNRPVGTIRELAWEGGFQELIDGWGGLMGLGAEALEQRLFRLAHAVLEDGIGAGDMAVVVFVVREEIRKRKAIATLAESVGRLIARDLARARAEAEGGEAAEDSAPAAAAPAADAATAEAAPAPKPRAAVDPVERKVWRAVALLRRRLFEEHLLWWRDERTRDRARRADDLRAAVAAAEAPAEPPAPEPPAPRAEPAALASLLGEATDGAPPSPAPASLKTALLAAKVFGLIVSQTAAPTPAFEESLSTALVQLPREKLEILSRFPPEAMARLLQMAEALPQVPPGPASTPAMPEGP